jgi:CDP-diacylglycerol--serine O-phosphatidyltransferase
MSEKNLLNRPRGIYFFPNLLTIVSLFASFYAIVTSMHARYISASIAIFIAMLMDVLDGRLARLTNTTTEFGAQLDSLCDMVSFGLTPALVLYTWSLHVFGKGGWLVAFLYAVCTALRLARFNTQLGIANKRYFQGLATPAAAGFVAGMVWLCTKYSIAGNDIAFPVLIMTLILALLKVSRIRYRSFKDLDLRGRVSFLYVIAMALLIILISFNAPLMLFSIFLVYTASGPLMTILGVQKRRKNKRTRHTKQLTKAHNSDAK